MNKPQTIIALLQKQIAVLTALEGQEIAHFAVLVPPDGEPLTMLAVESHTDNRGFFQTLTERAKTWLELSGTGGVTMPPGLGRR